MCPAQKTAEAPALAEKIRNTQAGKPLPPRDTRVQAVANQHKATQHPNIRTAPGINQRDAPHVRQPAPGKPVQHEPPVHRCAERDRSNVSPADAHGLPRIAPRAGLMSSGRGRT